jgi:hypothetical protein
MGEAELVPRVTKEDSPRERPSDARSRGRSDPANIAGFEDLIAFYVRLGRPGKKTTNRAPFSGISIPVLPFSASQSVGSASLGVGDKVERMRSVLNPIEQSVPSVHPVLSLCQEPTVRLSFQPRQQPVQGSSHVKRNFSPAVPFGRSPAFNRGEKVEPAARKAVPAMVLPPTRKKSLRFNPVVLRSSSILFFCSKCACLSSRTSITVSINGNAMWTSPISVLIEQLAFAVRPFLSFSSSLASTCRLYPAG